MDHTLYPTMASHVGVANYPVHAINGSNIWARSPEYFKQGCDEVPNIEISWGSSGCRQSECASVSAGQTALSCSRSCCVCGCVSV